MAERSVAGELTDPRDPADGIGPRVAAYRTERGMRVSDLAREVGVSPSLVSQIERGQSRPSVSTLFAIAQALGVAVDAFFRETDPEPAAPPVPTTEHEDRYVVRRANRSAIDIESAVRWERLTPAALKNVEFLELIYGPGAESSPTLYRHPGEEMILVLAGQLDIHLGFECYHLVAGDSMHFPSMYPHRYVNPTGEVARAVTTILHDGAWYATPPASADAATTVHGG
jgi:transcriptional regulator with XRE-family HTH domain